MLKHHGRTVATFLIGAVALIAASCGVHDTSTPPTSLGVSAGGTTTTPPLSTGGSGAVSGTQVTVTETEYHLAFSSLSFQPGKYTFTADNKGQIVHALAVTGPGVSAATADINPGASANLVVTLKAGSYDVFCPVPGHKALGMNQEITVG